MTLNPFLYSAALLYLVTAWCLSEDLSAAKLFNQISRLAAIEACDPLRQVSLSPKIAFSASEKPVGRS